MRCALGRVVSATLSADCRNARDILPVGKFPGLPKVKDLGGSTGTDLIVSTNASGSNYTISAHSFSTAVMNTIKK